MQARCLAILLLFCLFVIPGHAGAAPTFIIEGKIEPVQVHSTAPAIDRNPVHKWHYPTPLGPSTQQADQSRTLKLLVFVDFTVFHNEGNFAQ